MPNQPRIIAFLYFCPLLLDPLFSKPHNYSLSCAIYPYCIDVLFKGKCPLPTDGIFFSPIHVYRNKHTVNFQSVARFLVLADLLRMWIRVQYNMITEIYWLDDQKEASDQTWVFHEISVCCCVYAPDVFVSPEIVYPCADTLKGICRSDGWSQYMSCCGFFSRVNLTLKYFDNTWQLKSNASWLYLNRRMVSSKGLDSAGMECELALSAVWCPSTCSW